MIKELLCFANHCCIYIFHCEKDSKRLSYHQFIYATRTKSSYDLQHILLCIIFLFKCFISKAYF